MVRQARSEATRKRIINAAVDLFAEVGYQATGLGDIIERAEMTKGALYYHFDSKEALATAIIEEGANTALTAFRSISEPSSPALENMIHGVFVVADLMTTDKMVRTGSRLLRASASSTPRPLSPTVTSCRRWSRRPGRRSPRGIYATA